MEKEEEEEEDKIRMITSGDYIVSLEDNDEKWEVRNAREKKEKKESII